MNSSVHRNKLSKLLRHKWFAVLFDDVTEDTPDGRGYEYNKVKSERIIYDVIEPLVSMSNRAFAYSGEVLTPDVGDSYESLRLFLGKKLDNKYELRLEQKNCVEDLIPYWCGWYYSSDRLNEYIRGKVLFQIEEIDDGIDRIFSHCSMLSSVQNMPSTIGTSRHNSALKYSEEHPYGLSVFLLGAHLSSMVLYPGTCVREKIVNIAVQQWNMTSQSDT